MAPTTLRQLTEKKTYQGPVLLHESSKPRNRRDAENSLTNISRDNLTIIRDGGKPTTSNFHVATTA